MLALVDGSARAISLRTRVEVHRDDLRNLEGDCVGSDTILKEPRRKNRS